MECLLNNTPASIRARRSSSSKAFMSGGRQSDTERCTASLGVESTATSRARIWRIFGSSSGRWTAKQQGR